MKSNTKIISVNEVYVCGKMLFLAILGFFLFSEIRAQDTESMEKAKLKSLNESIEFTYNGNELLKERSDAIAAEIEYRKAISKSSDNAKAKYNLGNVYYNQDSMGEAFMRYKEAGTVAKSKEDKHRAYHNLGNVFMRNKEYQKAVEVYKEALRNNPTDEETRYNFALAKEMLKKQQDENKNNQNQNKDDQKQDKNKDNQEQNQDNKNSQDKKDGDKGDEKKDDQGKEDDKNNEGDNKDEQGKNPEDQKQKEGKRDKQDQKQNSGDKPQEQQKQRRPNQLSPQQVKNILEAMNNEERKVQEKMNAEKVKGTPVKSEKDW